MNGILRLKQTHHTIIVEDEVSLSLKDGLERAGIEGISCLRVGPGGN